MDEYSTLENIVYVALIFGIPVLSLILGICQYIRQPKPPKDLSMRQLKRYYSELPIFKRERVDYEEENEPEEPPYYIIDKLTAYDNQIESYNALLEKLSDEWNHERDDLKRAKIRKQQADIMTRLATIEEKAYKLRDSLE